jgi:hypothetical protein
MPFDHRHYVPILKAKRGEYDALEHLGASDRDLVTPLLEIAPIPWDFENDTEAKSVNEHLAGTARLIDKAWGNDRELFVDLRWLDDEERLSTGEHPVEWLWNDLRTIGVKAVPVTALDHDDDFHDTVATVAAADGRGVCLRLAADDLVDLAALAVDVDALLGRLGVDPSAVDLIVDLGAVPADNASVATITAGAVLPVLPRLTEWRTLTLAAASFPEDLSDVNTDSMDTIRRADWLLWHGLVNRQHRLPRLPSFGDYAIGFPVPFAADPRIIQPASNIRYAAEEHWVIVKGRSLRRFGHAQFHADARRLMTRTEWRGDDHCWGCREIAAISRRSERPGSQTTWRAIGTHHHAVTVCEQLRALP